MSRGDLRHLLTALAVATMMAASDAHAKKLEVAVTGVDGPTCGGKATPCRSIARTIANAVAGDAIVVGPGRYGDLDGDAVLGEVGEEPAPAGETSMLVIDKPLTVTSRDGALATVIDASTADRDLVSISSNGVVFGKPRKGFTLQNAPSGRRGLVVSAPAGSGIVVAGNLARANDAGFVINAPSALVTANQAANNSFGFVLGAAGVRLVGNLALSNVNDGLNVLAPGSAAQIIGNAFIGNGSQGARVQSTAGGVLVRGNVASGNGGSGFAIGTDAVTITGNVATGNGGSGFFVNGTAITVTKNTAYANAADGVAIGFAGADVTVTGNNLAGNDLVGATGCGVSKFLDNVVDATGNFWGAPTGPGPAPADKACDDSMANTFTTTPFSTKEIKVKTKPPKVL
jgi:parallel beta-helix repeat protein